MKIKTFIEGPIQNNNYLIMDEASKEAVLIDCTSPTDEIMNFVKESGSNLKYILLTHGHFDHVMGVNYHLEKYNIPTFAPLNDKEIIQSIKNYVSYTEVPKITEYFDKNKVFTIGNQQIKILETPGHTKGSVCFLLEDTLFSGDTMFYHTYGRTDLPTGNEREIFESIKKLLTLPPKTKVLPGHGNATNIQEELKTYTR